MGKNSHWSGDWVFQRVWFHRLPTVKKIPKLPRKPQEMVKLMETKLPWSGPSLPVKVALVEGRADLVAEAREASEVPEEENRGQATSTENKV